MTIIENLERAYQEIEKQIEVQEDLEKQQAKYLKDLYTGSKAQIDWVHEKKLFFKHPSIKGSFGTGPILHEHDEYVFVYGIQGNILKFDIHRRDYEDSSLREVIRLGGFIKAVQGILYVEESVNEQLLELRDQNRYMQNQLISVENY